MEHNVLPGQSEVQPQPPQRTRWSGKRVLALQEPITLTSGESIGPVEVAYETWGKMSPKRDNVILICHALSGDAHVADGGQLSSGEKDETGWWRRMVGPNKPIDTNRFFVICSNVIGGCSGTTGPSSQRIEAVESSTRPTSRVFEPASPVSGREGQQGEACETLQDVYGTDFPLVTVEDMVEVQSRLLDALGIERIHAVIGGSLGGMQALVWAKAHPQRVERCIAIATTWHSTAQNIAFNEIGRRAILSDPRFCNGRYARNNPPRDGLAVARMIGHVTYLSDEAMTKKFGTDLLDESYSFALRRDFQVESYLEYQGSKFVDRFDANTYLYLTKALDYFALVDSLDQVDEVFSGSPVRFLLESFTSDWLFPTNQLEPLAYALARCGCDVSFTEIEADGGHDSFLLKSETQEELVTAFLNTERSGSPRHQSNKEVSS